MKTNIDDSEVLISTLVKNVGFEAVPHTFTQNLLSRIASENSLSPTLAKPIITTRAWISIAASFLAFILLTLWIWSDSSWEYSKIVSVAPILQYINLLTQLSNQFTFNLPYSSLIISSVVAIWALFIFDILFRRIKHRYFSFLPII